MHEADNRIKAYKNTIEELKEEIVALRQLLDCAAANIVLLANEKGGKAVLSKKQVSEVLGHYKLSANRDGEGNYVLEIKEE